MKKFLSIFTIAMLATGIFVQKIEAQTFDEASIDKAIEDGDCAFLYKFTQSKNPNPTLLAKANSTINFYTSGQNSIAQYHTDKMDAKVRKVPKEITDEIFNDPETYVPQLVTFLANGAANNFVKVKIFHDWICDNIAYDTEIAFQTGVFKQDYITVIKKRKAVCAGYADILNAMCYYAGIESKTVSGYSKDFGPSKKIAKVPDHDWNAVKINGRWYLVDATWDAGYVDYKTYIKRYSTQYLFWSPRVFLYSHLAQNDAEQFYAPPLTQEQFEKEPKVEGKFFQKGLSLVDDKLCYSNETNGEFQFEIKSNSNSNLYFSNRLFGKRNLVEGATWRKRKGSTITFCYDVPDGADYQGVVDVQTPGSTQDVIEAAKFESHWIPAVEQFLKEKKITEKEKEYFDGAYFKVEENSRYYLYDDQFATARNAAIEKISKLVKGNTVYTEAILSFNLKAAAGYAGFGKGIKYPYSYITYSTATNTELIAPITGSLKAGTKQKFEIRSGNFTSFAFIIDGKGYLFEKNAKTGNFEIEFEIPAGIDKLNLLGSTNGKNFNGLVWFEIEK